MNNFASVASQPTRSMDKKLEIGELAPNSFPFSGRSPFMQTNDTVPEVTTAAPATPEVASVTPEIVESPSTGAPPASGPPNLEETLKQAQQQAEEYHDAWLRAKAETENVRRRAQEDISKAAKFAVDRFAVDRFARELLAVKDSLEAALATETASVENRDSQCREPSIRYRTDPQATGRGFRKVGTDRGQPAGRKVRPSSTPGDQRRRITTGTQHRGQRTAEGLPAGRPRTAPGPGRCSQGQRLKSSRQSPIA